MTRDDLISRQEVNKLVDELARSISDERCFMSRGRDTSTIMQDILDLPSVTPKSRWIPVSERLPGEDICEAPGPVWKRKVLITGYHSWNSKKDTFIGVAFARDVKNDSIQDVNVIAWMPLPEIYKESEE